ncbi:MAG TPA: SDR family oxidoreductase [Rubrobacter sp.]|nr:SDR family oxidoreductase [Rubrobacter sp.]
MRDRIALVTGAGAGIGRAIALRLSKEGAAVVVADVDEESGAETVRRIEADAGRGAFVLADVATEAGAREMVEFAGRTFGGLDVLVNNAGGAPEPHFPEAAPEHWLRTLDLNLRGVMLSIHFGLMAMRRRGGGVIVNISSMAGVGYQPYHAPEYAAGKAGVVRLTTSLAYLKENMGVRVNCICPGWVETEAVHEALARMTEREHAAQSMPPPDVLIQPDEIADAVGMFVRDDTLAGRVMIWPDGEQRRLVPIGAMP